MKFKSLLLLPLLILSLSGCDNSTDSFKVCFYQSSEDTQYYRDDEIEVIKAKYNNLQSSHYSDIKLEFVTLNDTSISALNKYLADNEYQVVYGCEDLNYGDITNVYGYSYLNQCSYKTRYADDKYTNFINAMNNVISNTIIPRSTDDAALRTLFIGNSYTYYNDMPKSIYKVVGESYGYSMDVDMCTVSSEFLINYSIPTTSSGLKLLGFLNSKQYDVVFLQEQSTRPIVNNEAFKSGVHDLCELLRSYNPDVRIIMYETHAKKIGNVFLTENNLTNEEMNWKMGRAYQVVGELNNVEVSYAGFAVYEAYHTFLDNPDNYLELYKSDEPNHPAPAGSALIALTHLAKVYNLDPKACTYTSSSLVMTSYQYSVLKTAAFNATYNTPSIPEEYL